MKKSAQKSAGFTLIEIMVAVSIFVIVAFIVTSTILTIITAARTANTSRLVIDNMNFALDDMTYKLKFGSGYSLPQNGEEKSEIDFYDRYSSLLSYCVGDDGSGSGGIYECVGSEGNANGCNDPQKIGEDGDCKRLTTPEVTVKKMSFKLGQCRNEIKVDGVCPVQQVVILVQAEAVTAHGGKTSLEFQTSVSQAQSQSQQ